MNKLVYLFLIIIALTENTFADSDGNNKLCLETFKEYNESPDLLKKSIETNDIVAATNLLKDKTFECSSMQRMFNDTNRTGQVLMTLQENLSSAIKLCRLEIAKLIIDAKIPADKNMVYDFKCDGDISFLFNAISKQEKIDVLDMSMRHFELRSEDTQVKLGPNNFLPLLRQRKEHLGVFKSATTVCETEPEQFSNECQNIKRLLPKRLALADSQLQLAIENNKKNKTIYKNQLEKFTSIKNKEQKSALAMACKFKSEYTVLEKQCKVGAYHNSNVRSPDLDITLSIAEACRQMQEWHGNLINAEAKYRNISKTAPDYKFCPPEDYILKDFDLENEYMESLK